jgi:ArsR family transcriptional regulator, virulence genes transcriptional regulator
MYAELFSQQEEIFKVIANQKRLEIIQLLTHGELSVNEMVSMLGISQSNVSQHLSLLRQADLVATRKTGTTVHYRLNDPRIAKACSLIRQFLVDRNRLPESSVLEEDPSSLYPLVQDPVCGMRMAISEVPEQATYRDQRHYFCGAGCKEKFVKYPDRYALKYN